MKFLRLFTVVCAALLISNAAQAQFFILPGTFSYSLNSIKQVFDITPDGKLCVTLRADPVAPQAALLTTFDPIFGTQFDSKTFGFGPLGVRLVQTPNGLRVVVLTSQGGARQIWIFDLNAAGKLTQLASTQLTTSNTDAGSNIVLSGAAQAGFVIVASGSNPGASDLVSFSLLDGSILNRIAVSSAGDALAISEPPGKRTLAFLKDLHTLELFDAANASQPIKLGDVALPPNSEFSGSFSAGIAFSGDGRFAFVGVQFDDFAVVDITTLQTIASIPSGNFRFGRVRIFEDAQRRIVALQSSGSGTGGKAAILLVDATDPSHLSILKQVDLTNFSYKGDMAFSKDGSRLYVLSRVGLAAYDLPGFSKVWEALRSSVNENQLLVYGSNDEVLGAWDAVNGTSSSSLFGAFPSNPPGISVNDVAVPEGDSGTSNANFTVTLSAPTTHRLTVDFVAADGTAIHGLDFASTSGSAVFEPGEITKTAAVPIIGDVTDEFDETLSLNLSSAVGIITRAKGTCTILDDDPPPSVSISDVLILEGNSGIRNASFAVTLSLASGKPISLNFSTSDGTATAGSDYNATSGVLTLAAGQTIGSIVVPIPGDILVEPDETFLVTLSNPQNVTVGRQQATGTIISDDSSTGNPIDLNGFFVRSHYIDFLNREPDVSGFQFWTNDISSCGSDLPCAEVKRINVSAAFFLSIEFQETGYLVERMYKAAFGDANGSSTLDGTHPLSVPVIRIVDFLPDTQQISRNVIVNQSGWQQVLESNKVSFANIFVQRSRFVSAFPASGPNVLTPAQFVDRLFANAGVIPNASDRADAIGEFGGATTSADFFVRARVLRRVAENPAFSSSEFNRAFVLIQYFGYLRRNPNDSPDSDYTGYEFWLRKLNQFNGNFVNAEMVKAFISSSEYRRRFGP